MKIRLCKAQSLLRRMKVHWCNALRLLLPTFSYNVQASGSEKHLHARRLPVKLKTQLL